MAPGERDERRSIGRSLFAQVIAEAEMIALRKASHDGFDLGSGRFRRQIAAMVGQVPERPCLQHRQCRALDHPPQHETGVHAGHVIQRGAWCERAGT